MIDDIIYDSIDDIITLTWYHIYMISVFGDTNDEIWGAEPRLRSTVASRVHHVVYAMGNRGPNPSVITQPSCNPSHCHRGRSAGGYHI